MADLPFYVINCFRHLAPLGLREEPGEAGGEEAEGDEYEGGDGGVNIGQSGDGS